MSIFDIFKSAPQAPQQPQAPQPARQQVQQLQDQMSQQDPNQPQIPEANQPPSALDVASSLWQNDPNQVEDHFDPSKMFNLDPDAINKGVSQLDFTTGIPDEVFSKILAGGEGAVQAMRQVINLSNQRAFSQGLIGNTNLLQQALSKADAHMQKQVSRSIKTAAAVNSVREANPVFSDPKYAPMLSAVENQLVAKYPNASQHEIAQMAGQYLEQFINDARPAAPAQPKVDPASDFSHFLN